MWAIKGFAGWRDQSANTQRTQDVIEIGRATAQGAGANHRRALKDSTPRGWRLKLGKAS